MVDGDPLPKLHQITTIEKDGYNDHELKSVMHVGTHMDAPLHMIQNGKTMDQIPIEHFFGKGILIDARGKEKIEPELLTGKIIGPGSIVLIYTDFGSRYRDASYYEKNPNVTEGFAEAMVKLKVKIVGMDILGPDAAWVRVVAVH